MHYFGTDGIRGEAYITLNETLAYKVGKSLALLKCPHLLIGYDTRISNHMLADAIKSGAKDSNIKVEELGVITTPGLCYLSLKEKCIGVMITASHNPYYDNGIKIFLNGQKISDELELEIEDYLDHHEFKYSIDHTENLNKDKVHNYQDFLKSFMEPYDFKVGFDCANGATYELVNVFKNYLQGTIINQNPNGKNINDKCGSTHLEALTTLVKNSHLDVGFAFDGDGDRVLAIDEMGLVHTGDELIYVIARDLKEKGQLKNNSVSLTIMSNLGIIKALNDLGITVNLTSVGDRQVLESLRSHDSILGGENSGHIIQLDKLLTGDGMLTAITILDIMQSKHALLSTLTKDLTIWPDQLVNLKVHDKTIASDKRIQDEVRKYQEMYHDDMRLVIRASGTENLLRLSCCANSSNLVSDTIAHFKDLINAIDKEKEL